jgi:ABC-type transport system involved in multi-copper enzyme maturation permease subunit
MVAFAFNSISPNGGAIYTIAPYSTVYLFVLGSCQIDDKSNSDMIFNSLPLKREDIVFSKYISVFFFAAFGILSSILVGTIGHFIDFANINRFITLNDIIIVLSVGMIFSSIFYPMYFKLGINKMKFVTMFLFLLIMFVPSFISAYVQNHQEDSLVTNLISFFTNTSPSILQALYFIISCIIFLVSILISMGIYKNKDF